MTKQFTAAAVLRLQADGKLRVSDTLDRWIPGTPDDKRTITLEHLLTHRSGLSGAVRTSAAESGDRDAMLATVLGTPLLAPPGERFAYTNLGYHVLAAVVERASGATFEEFVRKRILVPAKMRSTAFVSDGKLGDVAQGHESGQVHPVDRGTYGWMHRGATGLLSTAGDLHRWCVALQGDEILPWRERVRLTETAAGQEYAYGNWVLATEDGKHVVRHGGNTPGFSCELQRHVENSLVVVVLCNTVVAPWRVAEDVARVALHQAVEMPQPTVALALADSRKWEGSFVNSSGARISVLASNCEVRVVPENADGVAWALGPDLGAPAAALRERADVWARRVIAGEAAAHRALDSGLLLGHGFESKEPKSLAEISSALGSLTDVTTVHARATPAGSAKVWQVLRFDRGARVLEAIWFGEVPTVLQLRPLDAYALRLRPVAIDRGVAWDLTTWKRRTASVEFLAHGELASRVRLEDERGRIDFERKD